LAIFPEFWTRSGEDTRRLAGPYTAFSVICGLLRQEPRGAVPLT
jgi:hypothetical protein